MDAKNNKYRSRNNLETNQDHGHRNGNRKAHGSSVLHEHGLIKGIFLTALDKLIKGNQTSKLTPSHKSAILLKDMTGKSIS